MHVPLKCSLGPEPLPPHLLVKIARKSKFGKVFIATLWLILWDILPTVIFLSSQVTI
jgi:hypothetical protein